VSDSYDCVIVGARCAGAPLARFLARGGARVLMVDAGTFLSDQPLSTHFIQPYGMRILDELVANALAFSPLDGIVTLRVTQGTNVEVRVIDQGPGIDEAALTRIFEPLEQAEHLSTRTHQGIGIGLSLARLSAHALGGDVTLEETGPDGSTFLWSLAVS